MTVETTNITSGPYVGNGLSDEYSYDFRITDKTQLIVYETDDDGVQTVLEVDTDYTVAGIGEDEGGTITRVAGNLPTGYVWYIRSNYAATQTTAFASQGGFFPRVHELTFDKITFLIQQLLDRVSRSFRFSDGYSGSASPILPTPEPNTYPRWNSTGDALVNDPGSVNFDANLKQYGRAIRKYLTGTTESLASSVPSGIEVGEVVSVNGYSTSSEVSPTQWCCVSTTASLPGGATAGVVNSASGGELYVLNSGSNYYQFKEVSINRDVVIDLDTLRELTGTVGLDAVDLAHHTTPGDGGGGFFRWVSGASAGTYVDNDGTIIVPTGGDGSAAWLREYTGSVNIKWFGIDNTGVSDVSAAMQALFTWWGSIGGGDLVIPPGTYNFGSTNVQINGTTNSALRSDKKHSIHAYGAAITGTGRLVINSVKNLKLAGIDLQAGGLNVRGMWWCNIVDCLIGQLYIGDSAGGDFSTVYWNKFDRTDIGQIYLGTARSHTNHNTFVACTIRSRADQGFPTLYDYSLEIYGNISTQNLNFYSCDISYADTAFMYVDAALTRTDTMLNLVNCYFDTNLPGLSTVVKVNIIDCESASGSHYMSYSAASASKSKVHLVDEGRFTGINPMSAINHFVDGYFLAGADARRALGYTQISNGTKTYYSSGGVKGGYVDVDVASSTTVFWYAPIPTAGLYTTGFWVQNGNAGSDTISVRIGAYTYSVTVSDSDWTFVCLTPNTNYSAGDQIVARISHPSSSAFRVKVSAFFVTMGREVLLFPSVDPEAISHLAPVTISSAGYGSSDGPTAVTLMRVSMPAPNDSVTLTGKLIVHVHDRGYKQGGGIITAQISAIHRNGGGGELTITQLSNVISWDSATPVLTLSRTVVSTDVYDVVLTMTSDEGAWLCTFKFIIEDVSYGSSSSSSLNSINKLNWKNYVAAQV